MVTLKDGERSILATFPSSTKAKAAVDALKAAGFEQVQLDVVSKYPSAPDEYYNNPIAGQAVSLSSLTLNSENASSGDAGPLMAADTSANGLSSGDDMVGFDSFLVTVVTSEDKLGDAVSIIKGYGGEV